MTQSMPLQPQPTDTYYNHLIFDNSLSDGGFFFSHTVAIAPSQLEDDRRSKKPLRAPTGGQAASGRKLERT
jgi:hypothetical protein